MAGVALNPAAVDHEAPRRVRRPVDIARLVLLLALLTLLIGSGVVAQHTASAASEDLARAVSHLPRAFTHLLSFAAGLVIIVLPLGYAVDLMVHRKVRVLLEALAGGTVALGVVWGLGRALLAAPHGALYHSLTLTSVTRAAPAPVDSYLAALAAFAVLGGMVRDVRWRWYYGATVVVYTLSALVGAQASLLALAVSFVMGVAVAVAGRFVMGTPDQRPGAPRIADAVIDRGIALVRLTHLRDPTGAQREFSGVTESGQRLQIIVLDRDMLAPGALYRLYRMLRVRSEVTRGPSLSMERSAERRALLSMAAEKAGLPVPALIAGVPCGPDAVVLVHEAVDATPILATVSALRDAQLVELWRAVCRLHESRVTHRRLTPERMWVDHHGQILVASPTVGSAFATNLRVNLDRAELLISTARLVGALRAVRVAREVIGPDGLSAIRPVMQPIAFSRETRTALRRNRSLLSELWDEIGRGSVAPAPELSDLERVRPRTILVLVAAIVAGYLLIGQLGTVDLATVFTSLQWQWVPIVVAGSALTYLGSAVALIGFVRERLSLLRTMLAHLAATFTGFVTPAAVGGMALNVRYLRQSGVSSTGAATSVAVNQVVGVMSYVVLLVFFGVASGTSTEHSLPIPGWAFIVVGVGVAAGLLIVAIPQGRRWVLARVMPMIREVLPRLAYTATRPMKLAEGVGGTLLLNAAYILALCAAVQAFGGGVALATVAVVYLAGGAIGSAAPTPGGLGAVEAAMSTGLTAAGMPGASAVSAVLLFRLATLWLPVPLGWLSFSLMQRRGWL